MVLSALRRGGTAARRLAQLVVAMLTLVLLTVGSAPAGAAPVAGVVVSACACAHEHDDRPSIRELHGCCAHERATGSTNAAPSCCGGATAAGASVLHDAIGAIAAAVDSGDSLDASASTLQGRAPPGDLERPPRGSATRCA
jgi:hypothetical protein